PLPGERSGHRAADRPATSVHHRDLVLQQHLEPPSDVDQALHSRPHMGELPTGTVTFLFTDIEGSTRLLQELGEAYPAVLEEHAAILRGAIGECGGVEVSTEGDSFSIAFASPVGAVRCAVTAQRGLAGHDWSHGAPVRVRMGLAPGDGVLGGRNYVGLDVNRAARQDA